MLNKTYESSYNNYTSPISKTSQAPLKLWQKIFRRLLYLTPIGYFMDSVLLLNGNRIKGLNISFRKDAPMVTYNQNPTLKDRFNWLIDGVFLTFESWMAVKLFLRYPEFDKLIFPFLLLAPLYALVAIIFAIFPRVPWNKRLW